MVSKRASIVKIITALVGDLEDKGIPVEEVYLFGSYAWGKPNRYSDVDLAVVSKKFEKIDKIRRLKLLLNVIKNVCPEVVVDIDVVGFTSNEMKQASYFDLAALILEKGEIMYKKAA